MRLRPIFCAAFAAVCAASGAFAAPPKAKPTAVKPAKKAAKPAPAKPAPASNLGPVELPRDAGTHDKNAAIEWWYFNAFLTGESRHKWAVIGSFFQTGLPGPQKGHYLIYSLLDLETGEKQAHSILDPKNAALLKSLTAFQAAQNPGDPRPLTLLGQLNTNKLPPPHRVAGANAVLQNAPFSIALEDNSFTQAAPDARTWQATLGGDEWSLDLNLAQTDGLPPMRVGGIGRTGLKRPDDMAYLSLTHMNASGTLTQNGVVDTVKGIGWVDRQWGTSWVPQAGGTGWDWWGVHLSDDSDLIMYRVRNTATGKVLRAEATLLKKDGTQIVDKTPTFSVVKGSDAYWTDKETGITFPMHWKINLPKLGLTLQSTPAFNNQTIPVIGIGDAIWEGVVNVSGTSKETADLTGQGYMELVGYKSAAQTKAAKTGKP